MRRQDELLALYPGQDRANRKFMLAEIDQYSLAFDSEELLNFLQVEIRSPEPILRRQALYTLQLFLPGFIRKKYGVSPLDRGVWSTYLKDVKEGRSVSGDPAPGGEQGEDLRRRALDLLHPVVTAIVAIADHPSTDVRFMARLALAQFPVRPGQEFLLQSFHSAPQEFLSLLCFVRSGGLAGNEALLGELLGAHAHDQPDFLVTAAATPRKNAVTLITDLAGRTSLRGRIALAIAMRSLAFPEMRAAAAHLMGYREDWVDVYCLRALEASGDLAVMEEVLAIHDRSRHPFVRAQALRAAGGLEGTRAIDFCLSQLEGTADPVQAQALESLVRLRCPRPSLEAAAAPLATSPFLRTRVNALLAMAPEDVDTVPPDVTGWIHSDEAIDRIEAGYCLGYLQNRESLGYLRTLASMDPLAAVSAQAIKSLSRYPASLALPCLLPIVLEREDELALTAARVLARYEGEEALEVASALAESLKRSPGPTARSLIYRTLGTVAGKTGHAPSSEIMAAGLREVDARVLVGSLEGWKTFGRCPDDDVTRSLKRIVQSGDAAVAPRALVASFLLGDLDAVASLVDLLRVTEVPTVLKALEAAMELGLLVSEVVPRARFPELDQQLALKPTIDSRDAVELAGRCWNVEEPEVQEYRTPSPEPEFEVRTGRLAPGSDPPRPEVTRIRNHRGPAPPRGLAPGLEKNTYLVGNLGDVEDRGPLATLWSAAQEVPSYLMSNKILLVPPIAALIVLGIFLQGAPAPRVRPAPPAKKIGLSVLHVSGPARIRSPETVLGRGDVLQVGDWVEALEGAQVRMLTPLGSRVEMRSPGRLTVRGVSDDESDLEVEITPGGYFFDFVQAGEFTVHIGDTLLHGAGARLGIDIADGATRISPEWGQVTMVKADGSEEPIPIGEKRSLP